MDTVAITTTAAHAKTHLAMTVGGAPLCRGPKATSCRPTDRVATCRKCIKLAKQPEPDIAAALAVYKAANRAHLAVCDQMPAVRSRLCMLRSHINHATGPEWQEGLPVVKARLEATEAESRALDAEWERLNAVASEALDAFRALVHGKGQRVRDYLPMFAD